MNTKSKMTRQKLEEAIEELSATFDEAEFSPSEAYEALKAVQAALTAREGHLLGLLAEAADRMTGEGNSIGRLTLEPTNRGFLRADFNDANSDRCSIQESSRDGDYLWLGQNSGNHLDGECMARMHLDRETAAELIPLLVRFVRTGGLRDEEGGTEEPR